MLNVFLLSLFGAIFCTFITAGVSLIRDMKLDKTKEQKMKVYLNLKFGIISFIINFLWGAIYLYFSCKEQTFLSLIIAMRPALLADFLMAIFTKIRYKGVSYQFDITNYSVISTFTLFIISVIFAISGTFAPRQNLVSTHDIENTDMVAEIISNEDIEKIKNDIKSKFDPNNNYSIKNPKLLLINGEYINVYIFDKNNAFSSIIPGYAIQKSNGDLSFIAKKIYFGLYFINAQDSFRTVRTNYPTLIIEEDGELDVDDEWTPYEVFAYRESFYYSDGKDDYGIITLNLTDGTCTKYPASDENYPSWLDFKSTIPR